MDIARATLKSDNTVYAQLDLDLGPQSVADTAKDMGITTKLDGYPAEGLGGLKRGVSPLEMANAYATLASGGIRNKPIAILRVKFPDGDVEDLGKPKRERVFSDAVAYEVTKILKQNVQSGTGTRANIGCPSAGKTGTTDNFNDAWFDGYTPHLATRRVGRLPGRARGDAQRARHLGRGRDVPRDDLEQVHAGGQGRALRRLPAAEEHDQLVAVLRQVLEGRQPSTPTAAADGYGYGDSTGGGYQGYDPASTTSPTQPRPRMTEAPAQAHPRVAAAPAAAAVAGGSRRPRWRCSAPRTLRSPSCGRSRARTSCPRRPAGRPAGCSARCGRSAPGSPTERSAGRCSTSGLWIALLAWCVVLARARELGTQSVARGDRRGARRCSCSRLRCFRRTSSATSPTRGSTSCTDSTPTRTARATCPATRPSPTPDRRTSRASTGRSSRSRRSRSRSSASPPRSGR